jgi:malate/lactate dehydrogenase
VLAAAKIPVVLEGVNRVLEPEMSDAEQQGLQRSAEAIKAAFSRLSLKESRLKRA